MGLTEGIPGKGRKHIPYGVDHLPVDSPLRTAVVESPAIVGQLLQALFAEHFPQPICFGQIETRQCHGHLQDVFLINQNAVGFSQHFA